MHACAICSQCTRMTLTMTLQASSKQMLKLCCTIVVHWDKGTKDAIIKLSWSKYNHGIINPWALHMVSSTTRRTHGQTKPTTINAAKSVESSHHNSFLHPHFPRNQLIRYKLCFQLTVLFGFPHTCIRSSHPRISLQVAIQAKGMRGQELCSQGILKA